MSNQDRIRPEIEHIITSAYQDMEGVMLHRKGYKLRHTELTDLVLSVVDGEIHQKVKEELMRLEGKL